VDIEVDLINSCGTDLTVVNAARVSFDKEAEWGWERYDQDNFKRVLRPRDKKLIEYLAEHEHWSPFAHTFLQFRITAPIFVARQLGKHQVGLVWNEISRRYVNEDPVFFKPKEFRGKPIDKKQGSSEEVIDINPTTYFVDEYDRVMNVSTWAYKYILSLGVCPEQARLVLPQAMMTSWYWSGSLYAFSRVYNLRTKEDAQKECRDVVNKMGKFCSEKFPVSWSSLTRSVSY
jgi:thymidylate synthase (FAD)